jgi:Holliday junction resolvase
MVRCAVGTPLLKALSNPSLACERIMAATPEAKVKARVVKQLKEMGVYHFSPVTGGFGRSGVPDIVGCMNGQFFALECKAGRGMTTALQEKNIEFIRENGGFAMVVNENNMDAVSVILKLKLGALNAKQPGTGDL